MKWVQPLALSAHHSAMVSSLGLNCCSPLNIRRHFAVLLTWASHHLSTVDKEHKARSTFSVDALRFCGVNYHIDRQSKLPFVAEVQPPPPSQALCCPSHLPVQNSKITSKVAKIASAKHPTGPTRCHQGRPASLSTRLSSAASSGKGALIGRP